MQSSSRISHYNGSSKWNHSRKKHSRNNKDRTRSTSFHNALKTRMYAGWKTSVTGVSAVNCGGDTGFRLGTIKKQAKSTLARKHQPISRTGSKTTMFSIHGSLQPFGRSQRWVGRTRTQRIIRNTSRHRHSLRVMTSSPSGYHG